MRMRKTASSVNLEGVVMKTQDQSQLRLHEEGGAGKCTCAMHKVFAYTGSSTNLHS